MSGHSKWKNIMHKKEKNDSARASVFTKIGKEMSIAVREGGPDPNSNSDCATLSQRRKPTTYPMTTLTALSKKPPEATVNSMRKWSMRATVSAVLP